ncbi:WD40-repeat-containing domain protein [Suillus variegatus]|nr:WD40-repeat-containing domain protein [Suillus variegatus]
MDSAPTLKAAATKSPSMTLKGHRDLIQSISYFPDSQRIISGSWDKTTRQWDLKVGKEIEEARGVCEGQVWAVAVSKDGRWVVTASGGDGDRAELKACEVETGIVRTFAGHSRRINCIDISADNTLLASGSEDKTTRIWNLGTGKLVAGPFRGMGAVRFSTDSKKLAVMSWLGMCLEVRDVQSQKLDAKIGEFGGIGSTYKPAVCWTKNNKTIIAPFNFITNDDARTIHEFDASTLVTVGAPFEGHTKDVTGLALSFDHALLASASFDNTIKLWDYESRQLLASFDCSKSSDPYPLTRLAPISLWDLHRI